MLLIFSFFLINTLYVFHNMLFALFFFFLLHSLGYLGVGTVFFSRISDRANVQTSCRLSFLIFLHFFSFWISRTICWKTKITLWCRYCSQAVNFHMRVVLDTRLMLLHLAYHSSHPTFPGLLAPETEVPPDWMSHRPTL